MTLVRWDPFRDLLSIDERLNRILSGRSDRASDDFSGARAPLVDIFEDGDDLVIRAEIPGVEKDNVDIRVEDGTLVLSGERKRDEELKDENSYRVERSYGKFSRSFRLPTTVDASKIVAQYKDGVIEIKLPKLAEAKPRKIKIQAA